MFTHSKFVQFCRRRPIITASLALSLTLLTALTPPPAVKAVDLGVTEEQYIPIEEMEEAYITTGASLISYSSGSEILLQDGQPVVIRWNGEKIQATANNETVTGLLKRLKVEPAPLDMVSVDLEDGVAKITVDAELVVYEREETVQESPVTYIYDDVLPTWSETVVKQGKDGVRTAIYEVVYSEGVEQSRQLVEVTQSGATETVIRKGTLDNFAHNADKVSEIVKNGDGSGTLKLENGQEVTFNKVLNMKATAYTAGDPGVNHTTATGTTVRVGTVAVDRRQIPFGTKMYIVSNDGAYAYGFSIAEDTGGAIKKNRIDLYFNTYSECIQFGVRNCTVYILD